MLGRSIGSKEAADSITHLVIELASLEVNNRYNLFLSKQQQL